MLHDELETWAEQLRAHGYEVRVGLYSQGDLNVAGRDKAINVTAECIRDNGIDVTIETLRARGVTA